MDRFLGLDADSNVVVARAVLGRFAGNAWHGDLDWAAAKLAASSLAVRKAGARWFVDVRSTVASPLPCWQQLTVCAGRRASLVACLPRLGGDAAYRADARPV